MSALHVSEPEHLVNVAVHGVGSLSLPEGLPNPYVVVELFKGKSQEQQCRTATPPAPTANAALGYFFSVPKHIPHDEFLASDVHVHVYHDRWGMMGTGTLLGSVTFSLSKVYAQPNHMAPKDWYPIALSEQPGEAKGFVQLTVGAYGPGDAVPRSGGGGDMEDGGEGRSLRSRVAVAPSPNRAGAIYLLTVRLHRAEGLREFAGLLGQAAGMLGMGSKSCDPYVDVSFNGSQGVTQVKKGASSPEFREEVRIPFLMPSWEDSVNVVLYCSMGGMSSPEEIGEVTLSVDRLLACEMQPTWHNFYFAPEVPMGMDEKALLPSAFAGRLLLSAQTLRTEQSQLPKAIVGPLAGSFSDPPLKKHLLWVDLYEVCFEVAEREHATQARVEVSWSPFEMRPLEFSKGEEARALRALQSRPPERAPNGHDFVWTADTGRMPPVVVQIPDAESCSVIIVSVYVTGFTYSGEARWMFLQIPLSDILPAKDRPWEVKPCWYQMRPVQGTAGSFDAGCIHMSINCGPLGSQPRARPPFEPNETDKYMFRATVCQATDVPAEDPEGSSDSFVAIFFGSAQLRTREFACCTNPSWEEVLEREVELPVKWDRRPDITILLLDADPGGECTALAQMKYCTRDPDVLPERWQGPPQWFDLQPLPGGSPIKSRILLAFELFRVSGRAPPRMSHRLSSLQDIKLPSKERDHKPVTKECRVEIFLVGLRCQVMELRDPFVQVSWGRQEEDPSEPFKKKITKQPFTGSDGNLNVLEKLVLKDLALAADGLRKEFLELVVLNAIEMAEDGRGARFEKAAFASLDLTPYLPWTRRAEALSFAGSERQSRAATSTPRSAPTRPARDPEEAQRLADLKLFREIGWDVDSIEASNARIIERLEHATLDKVDEKHCMQEVKLLQDSELLEDMPEVLKFLKTFEFPQQEATGDVLERHPDLDTGLETQLPLEELPYSTVELLGNHNNEPGVVGRLKFCCRVVEKNQRDALADEEWQRKLQRLKDGFKDARDLIVRAYVLSADELCPNSGSKDITSFVRSRASLQSDDFVHPDDGISRKHTLHPKFNTVHQFSHCAFPDQSVVEFSVWETASGWTGVQEQSIGADRIDLEDRWFHPRYQKMVAQDIVPIETRGLTDTDSSFCSGHLRLWIDILSRQEAQNRLAAELPSAEPVEFQLRLVVWTVTRIVCDDDETPDIYVTAEHTLDDGTTVSERTDTHYGCDDGKGTFNWRVLLNLMVPCNNPRITLRVLKDNWMSDEAFAEVNLDLTGDFLTAQRGGAVELKRDTVRMTNPSDPEDVRGVLDMEARLLPSTAALAQPVGAGREEPNEEPYLDPNDEHLVKHRNYLGNQEWFKDIGNIGGALFKGAMLMTALYVAGGAIATCLGTAMTIILAVK